MTSTRRLRIGIDGRELQGNPTGTGRVLRSILRHWSRRSDAELLVYLRGADAQGPPMAGLTFRPLQSSGSAPGVLFAERVLARAAEADDVDVFFAPAYECPLSLRRPRVTIVHDLSFFTLAEEFRWTEALRRRVMVARSVEASRLVVACSAFTQRELVARFPDAARRIVRVSWGADEDLPPPPPRDEARRQLAVTGPYILTVGSVFGRRRLPELLKAIALLARAVPDLILDVVGENRTHPRIDLPDLCRSLGVERHVRLSGFADEEGLAARYAAADAAVFLSEYEGFGLPPLEAASRGIPLVTSERPSLSEIFGDSALLVSPADPRGIADTLARVLRDEDLRLSLVRRGRDLARRLSWKHTADTLFEALQRAAGWR